MRLLEMIKMPVGDLPYFQALRTRLDYLGERQRLTAENIANTSTPGYTPRDTDQGAFERIIEAQTRAAGRLPMARTSAGHLPAAGNARPSFRAMNAPDSETTLDGNSVVLEDQMMRAAETRLASETALALYQKGLQLVRMAIKPPGR